MAITNFTEFRNQKTMVELACSADLNAGISNQLIGLSVLNVILSITAFWGNILILVALHKETSLHPPSKLLYRNLATTDLCVGIISEPLLVVGWMSVLNEQWNICRFVWLAAEVTTYILCSVSLFTLVAISVDRLLALLLGLRYRQVVTLKRTYLTVAVLWIVSNVGPAMYFWNYLITLWYGYIGITLCLITSIFCYTKIFLTRREHQIQVQDNIHRQQPNQGIPLNIARYKKAVSSALWVQLTLVVCYLPIGIVEAWLTQKGPSRSLVYARASAASLMCFNSSLNPILYCWKIKEIRQQVKGTIRQLCC